MAGPFPLVKSCARALSTAGKMGALHAEQRADLGSGKTSYPSHPSVI